MNILKRISLVALGSIILFTTITFAKTGTVNAPSGLVLREEKSKTSNPITTVNDKAKVEILEESEDWYKVKYNNYEGYLFAQYVDVNEEEQAEETEEPKDMTEMEQTEGEENNLDDEEKQNANSDLNIHTIPSVTSNIIISVKQGEDITINYELNSWVNVTYKETTGWVRKYFIDNENVAVESENDNKENETDEDNKSNEQIEDNKSTETTTTIENKKGYINVSSSANIRKEASTSSEVIDTLLRNAEVTIIGEEGDFYKIQYQDITGFISKSLVSDNPVAIVTSRSSQERKITEQENTDIEAKKDENTETATDGEQTTSNSSVGSDVVSFAKKYIGYNYTYGGNNPSTGFDCSGFASYVYNSFGYSIGRTCTEQSTKGTAVSRNNLLPGDLVFFNNGSNGSIGHVGIYMGDGQIVHAANSKTGVKTDTITSGYYNKYYYLARRIIK